MSHGGWSELTLDLDSRFYRQTWAGRISMQQRARGERPDLPPTGSSGLPMALASPSARACRAGSVILTAELIAGHDAEGERRQPRPGRSGCRRCPRSGSRAEDGHQPRIIQRAGPGRRPCPGTPRRSWPPRLRPPGHRRMRLPGAPIFLFRHHAERRGRSGRTHAYPPICIWNGARVWGGRGVPEWPFWSSLRVVAGLASADARQPLQRGRQDGRDTSSTPLDG